MLVYIYCMIVDVHVFLKPWLDMCLLLALQQGAMSWVLDILVLAHTTHQSSQSPGPSAGCHVWSTGHTRPSTQHTSHLSLLALQQGAMSGVLDILVLAHTTHHSCQSQSAPSDTAHTSSY